MSQEPMTLLIFEAGLRDSREYWLQDLKSAGYKLILAQPWPIDWEQPYVEAYLQCKFNPWTIEEKKKIIQFAEDHSVQGIICLNEGTVPFANIINDELGLTPICDGDINLLRDKITMRESLSGRKVLQPKFEIIREFSNITNLDIVFPAVVKPAQMMASLGVKLVTNLDEAISAIADARNVDFDGEDLRQHYGLNRDVLIESYVAGDEYSFETIVQRGEIVDFFVTKKFKCEEPYFDEIGHLSNPTISVELIKKIREFLIELHSILKIKNAITHTEAKVVDDEVVLIEIGCRPGGDLIPKITGISADLNVPEVLAKICTGVKLTKYWKDISNRKQIAVFFPHDTEQFQISRSALENNLVGSKIFDFLFDESAKTQNFNMGLKTVRRGQVVFASETDLATKKTLESLVLMSSGV